MRILYITAGFPYPLTSGLLRHYFFIKELSLRHAVTLLSLVKPDFVPEHLEGLRPFTEETLTFSSEIRPASLSRRALRHLFAKSLCDPAVERLGKTAALLIQEQSFDVVVYSGTQTLAALKYLDETPVVADLCDSTWVRFRSRLPYLGLERWPLALLYYMHARGVERHLLRHAAHSLLAAPRDREALGARAEGKSTVIPNGVDLDYWRRRSPGRGADTIIFTGAMHYRPNVDAALYLIEQILPSVRRGMPEARLLIVGRDPTPALVAAGQQPGVTVTGFVEDMRPYLEQATVFAAPLRFGAGIQNKVLEAMAMELPVVASPIASDGLRTEEGENPPIAIARGREEFAQQLVRQLHERRRHAVPDGEIRRYVERHFHWQSSGEKLERVLNLVTNGRQRRTTVPVQATGPGNQDLERSAGGNEQRS